MEPVVVWNNYADSIVGFSSSVPVTVNIPDDLWASWPDSVSFPGFKQWYMTSSVAFFDSGPLLTSGLLELKNEPDNTGFILFDFLLPDLSRPHTLNSGGGGGIVRSQTLSFRIASQGGDGQVYQWSGLNLMLVPPVSGSIDFIPPPPPPLLPVPVVHALAITVSALFSDATTTARGRAYGQVIGG
jgi:hypothetical protein